ncbi:MAG: transglycosylase domain-containing protein, partial [Spirochaetia bacterium]|nr:transglycosylase domain-containing protein [Spirochaetia bacterium]
SSFFDWKGFVNKRGGHQKRRVQFKRKKLKLFSGPSLFDFLPYDFFRRGAVITGAVGAAAAIVYGIFLFFYTADFKEYAAGLEGVQANHVIDRNGDVIAELFAEKTGSIEPGEIPEELKKILIFVEDEDFYDHGGIDYSAIARAMVKNILSLRYSQGGSTITQQLARILMKARQKTIFRKIREARFASYLESHFTKEEILLGYMNHIYLGHGAVGMDTAAKFYFDKELHELEFVEMLILSSLPSRPEGYSPLKNPQRIEKKMDFIFERMKNDNFPSPSRKNYEERKAVVFRNITRSPSETVFGSRVNDAPWVGEYVRIRLGEIFGDEYQYGAGLVIETTIDKNLQNRARKRTHEHIRKISKYIRPVHYDEDEKVQWGLALEEKIRKAYFDRSLGGVLFGLPQPASVRVDLQSASIGINPNTGEVLFIQGGTEFSFKNQYNRAVYMRRQTGSAIKPIVYSAAIQKGVITAGTPLDDTPLFQEEAKNKPDDKGYWLPDNITGVYEGKIPARRALAHSKNIPAIRVARLTGMETLSGHFRKIFFHTDQSFKERFRFDDTIAIGSLEMSPLDMALAFSMFANNGVIKRPYLIRSIKNASGEELYNGTGADEFNLGMQSEQYIISGDTAEVIASMMQDSAQSGGTGMGGALLGKTGTTNNHKDAWFVGVVPGLSAAVWVGFDDQRFSMPGATGSSVAGPLFGRIVSGYPIRSAYHFSPGARAIEICAESGALPNGFCPVKRVEVFTQSRGPDGNCELHIKSERTEDWSINKKSDFE